MESQASNVVDVDDDDKDVCFLYAKSVLRDKGCNSTNPISVETYNDDRDLSIAIMALASVRSEGRKHKRVIDLSRDHHNQDGDEVQFISSPPKTRRKIYKGESSNSNSNSNSTVVHLSADYSVDATFLCDICAEEKGKIESFRIKGCTHSYCSDCIAKYVSTRLQENNTNMACPVVGCDGKLEPQDCRSILPPEVFDRWGDALCEAMILASEKFYCPFKDCSALLIDDRMGSEEEGAITNSECPICWRMFCARCRVPWHPEISCEEFQKLNEDERGKEDIKLMDLAKKKKWKRCPKCRFFVSKSQGCMFMNCRCGCRFCYKCGNRTQVDHRCSQCKT